MLSKDELLAKLGQIYTLAKSPGKSIVKHVDRETLRQLYLGWNMSVQNISDRTGISRSALRRWLESLSIPKRPRGTNIDLHHPRPRKYQPLPPLSLSEADKAWLACAIDGERNIRRNNAQRQGEYGYRLNIAKH